jgi:hypothetical protein
MHLRLRHFLLLLLAVPAITMAQAPRNQLHFTSSKNQIITVFKGTIFVNGNKAYQLAPDTINYNSKRNRVIEDGGNVFLFLDIKGNDTNKGHLYVFGINNSKADSLMSAVSSDVKDYDHDEKMEFGGNENPKPDPSAGSMYYIPSKFYEIYKGRIVYDQEYSEKIEKKMNGVVLPEGSEDKVIPRPKH